MKFSDFTLTPHESREFKKHVRWFEDHLKVKPEEGGELIPFRLTDTQKCLEYIKWSKQRRKEMVMMVVLKARRVRASTWAEGTFFRDAVEHENRANLVIAHEDKSTKNLLDITKTFHKSYLVECSACGGLGSDKKGARCKRCLGDKVAPIPTEKDSAIALRFEENQSGFIIYTAGSREATARSWASQNIHASEVDFWEAATDTLVAGLQIVPKKYPTCVVVESTAHYPGGPMETLWNRATAGDTSFIPVFFAWFDHEDYTLPLTTATFVQYAPKAWKMAHAQDIQDLEDYHARRSLRGGSGEGDQGGAGRSAGGGGAQGVRPGDGTEATPVLGGEAVEGAGAGAWGRVGRVPGGEGRPVPGPLHRPDGSDPGDAGGLHEAGGAGRLQPAKAPRVPRRDRTVPVAILERLFDDSLTDYERGLIAEFGLSRDQINWLRFCTADMCQGSEIHRQHEYPSRPAEAFAASSDGVLDPEVLSKWTKEAKEANPERVTSDLKWNEQKGRYDAFLRPDPNGTVQIFVPPEKRRRYVMAVDPSEGFSHSDWQVACVLDVDTGDQVAEFRARLMPDLAVDHIEALGIHYNRAFTAVEVQGGGRTFQRHLALRGELPMYEREGFDKVGGIATPVKKGGWVTTDDNRKEIFAEMRAAVREGRCQIRSLETLNECWTLWEKPVGDYKGRIEARPGNHDDGVMAYGIALRIRAKLSSSESDESVKTRLDRPSFVSDILAKNKRREAESGHVHVRLPTKTVSVNAASRRVDGRRSVL